MSKIKDPTKVKIPVDNYSVCCPKCGNAFGMDTFNGEMRDNLEQRYWHDHYCRKTEACRAYYWVISLPDDPDIPMQRHYVLWT